MGGSTSFAWGSCGITTGGGGGVLRCMILGSAGAAGGSDEGLRRLTTGGSGGSGRSSGIVKALRSAMDGTGVCTEDDRSCVVLFKSR